MSNVDEKATRSAPSDGTFIGEVIGKGMPSSRSNKAEVEIRRMQGRFVYGPAQLVTLQQQAREVNILGVSLYGYRVPIDPDIEIVLVDGISPSEIKPGQRLIQGVDADLPVESPTRLKRGATITEAQATEMTLMVKAIGEYLTVHGNSSGYAEIYSEMYRRYHISTYRDLLAIDYNTAMAWLGKWYSELTSNT